MRYYFPISIHHQKICVYIIYYCPWIILHRLIIMMVLTLASHFPNCCGKSMQILRQIFKHQHQIRILQDNFTPPLTYPFLYKLWYTFDLESNSLCVPIPSILPLFRTMILSASLTVANLCAMISKVFPFDTSFINFTIFLSVLLSRLLVASSRIKIGASFGSYNNFV